MLGNDFSRMTGVPPGYVDRDNNAFMTNFAFVMDDLIRAVEPATLVEIGSAEGYTSRHLAGLARETGATLHVVDPVLAGDADFGSNVVLNRMKSRDFLRGEFTAAVWVIDGDHNHGTVTTELEGALRSREANKPFLVLLHDIGWPWARRDMFYDVSEASPGFLTGHDVVIEGGPPKLRQHLPRQSIAVSPTEGGERNGVLTAVEDFMSSHPGRFRFSQLTGFFGLGILYEDSTFPERARVRLAEVEEAHARLQPLLAALEANRLRLLQSHFDAMDEIARLQGLLDRVKSFPPVGLALALRRRLTGARR